MPSSLVRAWRDARASYTGDKRAAERARDLPVYFVYRPLSFLITPLFAWVGLSANAVTLLSIGVALLMPVGAALWHAHAAWAVAGLAIVFQVLDCVDGNLARMRRSTSTVGRMLDSIASLLFWAAYMVAVGIAAQGSSGHALGRHGREIGLALAVLFLAQREVEDTFEAYCGERVRWTPPAVGASWLDTERWGPPLEQGVALVGLVLAHAWGKLHLFLGLMAAWQCALLLAWTVRFAARVRRHMRG